MKYQLVLQFDGDDESVLDRLITLEHRLMEILKESAVVNGHDIGSGEANLFIITDHPVKTFEMAQAVADQADLSSMRAGYRDTESDEYIPIWPPELKSFQVI